jgi:uncharacterized membrane protein
MGITSVSHVVFAATMLALGVLGLVSGDFVAIWQPVPQGVPARAVLSFGCALVSLAGGIGLLLRRAAALSARLLLGLLALWLLLFRVPVIARAPLVAVSWEGGGETAVIIAGAWVLYASLASDWDRRTFGFGTGEKGLRLAQSLYALAMLAFGAAHFAYARETASLVPSWLPWHLAWAYITGAAYVAAGAAMLAGVCARLATTLSAVQMGAFTLLVWLPVVAAGAQDASQWSETEVSWALAVAGWVVADSYRGIHWLAVGRR